MRSVLRGLIPGLIVVLSACGGEPGGSPSNELSVRIRHDTKRSWDAYLAYAGGSDLLLPVSRSGRNWYDESLGISPVDAFSTLVVTDLIGEADEVVAYVADSLEFDLDMEVKVFELNIRVLGGLVSMYQLSGDPRILDKAVDFGRRLMPAFDTPTGIPCYWVNLRTGAARGKQVNVAEAGTCLLEMGMLSYFSGDPSYYQAAKKSTKAIFDRRSDLGLVGEVIDVETGHWLDSTSHIGAGTDSYYEYLYKGWLLFGDMELKTMWEESIAAVLEYIPDQKEGRTWYGRVHMATGERTGTVVTLWDAFMPALLALSGYTEEAEDLLESWDWLWNRYGALPMVYDYAADSVINPRYALNPELMESAWYLWQLTGEERFRDMCRNYHADLLRYCSTEEAFTSLEDVRSHRQGDEMPTYFLAETLKYLYLAFSDQDMYHLGTVVFSTEAHPYLKAALDPVQVKNHLELP